MLFLIYTKTTSHGEHLWARVATQSYLLYDKNKKKGEYQNGNYNLEDI